MYIREIVFENKPVEILCFMQTVTENKNSWYAYIDGSNIEKECEKYLYVDGNLVTISRFFDFVIENRDIIYNMTHWYYNAGFEKEYYVIIPPRLIDLQFKKCISISEGKYGDHIRNCGFKGNFYPADVCDTYMVFSIKDYKTLIDVFNEFIIDGRSLGIYANYRFIRVDVIDKRQFDSIIAKYRFLKET